MFFKVVDTSVSGDIELGIDSKFGYLRFCLFGAFDDLVRVSLKVQALLSESTGR